MAMSRRSFVKGVAAAGVAAATGTTYGELKRAGRESTTLTPGSIEDVVIDDPFWTPKRDTWRNVTIWDCLSKFETSVANFDRVRDGLKGGHVGAPWFDGLIYEMIRGASDFLRSHPDRKLEAKLDGVIQRIVAAAEKDPGGYVNTYTQLEEPGHEWGLHGGLEVWQHEFYNLGALVDAGLHFYRATGKTPLLRAAVRISNTLADLIQPKPGRNLVPAHELPEEAMLGLYELFHEQPALAANLGVPVHPKRYFELAELWIESRGNNAGKPDWIGDRARSEREVRAYDDYEHGRPSWGRYAQDHLAVFEQQTIEGHAVRATLMCSAVAALARVNGRAEYKDAALRLWENMTGQRMHITGGVGAFANDEAFGPDYVLPNDAYLETCAAVGAGFFHQNMNRTFGEARYVDELERALYNGILCGVSLAGDTYNYQNPLVNSGDRERWHWHDCPCCPPMFLKMMGAMPGYIYATDRDSAYVNLFVGSHGKLQLKGREITLKQTTRYPWDGHVKVEVQPVASIPFALMLRIPGWCPDASATLNGARISTSDRVRGYLRIDRNWRRGDVVELDLPMSARAVHADARVAENVGRAAVVRGPIVYCFEANDNDQVTALRNGQSFSAGYLPEKLGGIVEIDAKPGKAIPFYANGNRGAAKMQVWVREEA